MSLLDAALEAFDRGRTGPAWIDDFLREPSAAQSLIMLWQSCRGAPQGFDRSEWAGFLARELAHLDQALERQVTEILHYSRFQQVEASWRALWLLTGQVEDAKELADDEWEEPKVQIRVLSLSKQELARDLEGAIEFDQSQIFKQVYEKGLGMPGGQPFGLLVGDYQFTNHPEDVALLRRMSAVAAAAFAPFIAAPAPELLGLEDFSTLERPINLATTFDSLHYLKWRAFRDEEDSRFIGLVLPRVLLRLPREDDGTRADGFRFREDVAGPDRRKYLWGNGAYALACVLIRAFAASGWFAEIRGVQPDFSGGGLVTGLPVHSFTTDPRGIAPKTSTEVAIDEHQEQALSKLGLIPLCHYQDTDHCVFYSNQSVQKPKHYDDPAATANARISAMLQYMMCSSRFAHYLKVIVRDKVGTMSDPGRIADELERWIAGYVTPNEHASIEDKARYPLRQAKVHVAELPGQPGSYRMEMHLLPHFQLDELTAT
ncbi:MAG: type VI secretion system contractile sheath large subunit, partial [Planctomycetes bacterium]|nr:type VI secretion system contractile sheath large subunit [Planctomycetota bacterium]